VRRIGHRSLEKSQLFRQFENMKKAEDYSYGQFFCYTYELVLHATQYSEHLIFLCCCSLVMSKGRRNTIDATSSLLLSSLPAPFH
jgi:hypothetical protein